MKKDEIIQLLKEQLDIAMKENKELLQRVDSLLESISSLKEDLLRKDESLNKQKCINKEPTKTISKKSEKRAPKSHSYEGCKALDEEKDKKRKTRKNSGTQQQA